jgi:hypothetical protein
MRRLPRASLLSGPSWSALPPPTGVALDFSSMVATLPGAPDDLYLLTDDTSGGVSVYHYLL